MLYFKKIIFCCLFFCNGILSVAQQYKNFRVAVYSRAYETREMGKREYIEPIWNELSAQLKVDKIYLETHRDLIIVDQQTLDAAKQFFKSRGVEVAGGITYTVSEPNRFETFCYSNPEHRKKVREIAEHTARNFDEFILDDFFFTNCKCNLCIKAKGTKSWTQYRLDLMTEAAQSLVINPSKAVNPKVKIVIKYPNWYEHFQGLGFNLEKEPRMFDGIYTGTETRDAVMSNQHLQEYLGYNIFRYFENIKPGGNGGGWVDPPGSKYFDRYAEQLWITLFAKAPELTLFDIRQLRRPIYPADRAPWQGQKTSFDFEEMMQPVQITGSAPVRPTTIARAAGYTFEMVDKFLGQLGKPIGLKSYRPYHSVGEDFLQNYLGMAGIPIEQVPEFPAADSIMLLTEEAAFDTRIVEKIKAQLVQGKSVVITSGLLQALQGKGIEDIAELRMTGRKAMVKNFLVGRELIPANEPVLIPQIMYLTNDSWELVSGIEGANGWPLLHEAGYSTGKLLVLTIPENFADLYKLPAKALTRIREELCAHLPVQLEGPANVSIFQYDNNTFIVESFHNETTQVNIVLDKKFNAITDLQSNAVVTGELRRPAPGWMNRGRKEKNIFAVSLKPHSFRVFRF
jgi:hypothetical protein